MKDNNEETYKFLKENIYNKMKRKLSIFQIKVEYNILYNFLFNFNTLKTFFQKEMCNTVFQTSFINKKPFNKNYFDTIDDKNIDHDYCDFVLLNKNKNDGNDFFKVNSIYSKHCLNHSILILRFIKDETLNSINIDKQSSKIQQVLDLVISFYIDINDNSTVLINELYTNLSDHFFVKFNEIVHFFYQKLQIFVREKLNKYICFESILIQKNVETTFNYLYSCKIFHNEKFKIKKIKKIKNNIEITCEIGTLLPVNVCESKLLLKKLSKDSCLALVMNWMKTSDFKTQEKLLYAKPTIKLFLKKLRSRLNNEKDEEKKHIKK